MATPLQKRTDIIYVVGHVNPDTDSIASAMGYAWLLQDQLEETVQAARAGQLNPQTTWVLKRLRLEPPMLLADASPRFADISHRMNTTTPDRPLREAWAIANRTGGIAPVLNPDGKPYGLGIQCLVYSIFSAARWDRTGDEKKCVSATCWTTM